VIIMAGRQRGQLCWSQQRTRFSARTPPPRFARSRAAETPAQPVDLDQYRVRKQARVGGLINEYHLIA
jgi:hypothetical protein